VTELAPTVTNARRESESGYRMAWGLAVLTALSLIAGDAKADPPPPKQAEHATSAQATLPEMTVRAQRQALERRVQAFVSSGIRDPFEESLARWNSPICPLVVGLSREEDEFVGARLSEIAVAAGARLAPQPCQANFAVIVAAEPDAVLKAWYKRDYRLFGDATENRINEWLKTPRAARVWYNIKNESASGLPYAVAAPGLIGMLPPGTNIPFDSIEGSHIVFNSVRAFLSVIVAIDSGRAEGINLHKLADYAAMAGLAEIRLDADIGEVPTILRLFSTAEGAKPTGLTDWDASLLNALYNTSQETKLQRSAITHSMVRHLAP
jgi:hypothetical protein